MSPCPDCKGRGFGPCVHNLTAPHGGDDWLEPCPGRGPCSAEHVVVHTQGRTDVGKIVRFADPFFADPASVMWWCRVHKCSAYAGAIMCYRNQFNVPPAFHGAPNGCDIVPADEPVTYELWEDVDV